MKNMQSISSNNTEIDGSARLTINPEHRRRIDLSISLVSFNTKDLLENCLDSIFKHIGKLKLEVLVVDNASKDGTPAMVRKKFPQVKLTVNKQNLFFTKAHNQNLARVKGKYFLVLNEDIQIPAFALEKMIKFMNGHPKVGLASCREVDEYGKTDLTCPRLPHPITEFLESSYSGKVIRKIVFQKKIMKLLDSYRYKNWKRDTVREVDFIPGSFFFGKKEVLDIVGLFDENLLLFYEEPDYCQRAKKEGFAIYHNGKVKIVHLRTKAIAKLPAFQRYEIAEHDMLYYYKKYFGVFWWFFLWLLFRPNWIYWRLIGD